jgi:hypothetical protein
MCHRTGSGGAPPTVDPLGHRIGDGGTALGVAMTTQPNCIETPSLEK